MSKWARRASRFINLISSGDFDWYVDSINGNDANTGRSPSQAFQTIAALLATTLAQGETIGLARGSHWREQLTIAVDSVRVSAYGTGAAPILDASNIVPTWTKTGGRTNVYEATVDADLNSITWVNVWQDGAFMTRAASVAACDAAPGSYFPSSDTTGPTITLYIHATGSGDPNSNDKVYEAAARQCGLFAENCSNITVTGVTTRKQLLNDGSLKAGRYARLTDCRFEYGGKHNAYFSDGSVLTDCVAEYSYYAGASATLLVLHETTPAGIGAQFIRVQMLNTNSAAGVGGYTSHMNSGNFGTITWTDCAAVNCSIPFGSGTLERFTRCTITNSTGFYGDNVITAAEYIDCETINCTTGFSFNLAASVTHTGCTATEATTGFDPGTAAGGIFYTDCVALKTGSIGTSGWKFDTSSPATLVDCVATNYTSGYETTAAATISWNNCDAFTCTSGWNLQNSLNTLTNDCQFKSSVAGDRAIIIASGSLSINAMRICLQTPSAAAIYITGASLTISIVNSILKTQSSTGTRFAVRGTQASGTVTITGCTLDNFQIPIYLATNNLTSDNNFFGSVANTWRKNNIDYASLALWQAGTGLDANSATGGDGSAACV